MPFWIIISLLAAITALHMAAYLRKGSRRRRSSLAALVGFLAHSGIVYLLWVAFYTKHEVPASDDQRSRNIVVLEDYSDSMKLLAGTGRSRREHAAEVKAILATVLKKHVSASAIEVISYHFADGVAEGEKPSEDFNTTATRTYDAMECVAARTAAGSVLVLTDGCFAPALAKGMATVQAENRGVRFYAVTCADPDFTDVAIVDIQLERTNPVRASARIHATGQAVGRHAKVWLMIDQKEIAAQTVELRSEQNVQFTLSGMKTGWHELSIETATLPEEVYALNNVRKRLFEVTADEKIVFLYGSPDSEQSHLVRLLKSDDSFAVETIVTGAAAVANLNPETLALLIIGNVSPQALPQKLREVIAGTTARILFLGNALTEQPQSDGWPCANGTPFISQLPLPIVFTATFQPVIARGKPTFCPLRRILEFRNRPAWSTDLAYVQAKNGKLPVLVGDHAERPRRMVCLLDSTWRWKFNADADVRIAYDLFWLHVINRLRTRQSEVFEFNVDLAPFPDHSILAVARFLQDLPATAKCQVDAMVETAGTKRSLPMAELPAQGTYECRAEYSTPGMVEWWQATAKIGDTVFSSEKMPVFRDALTAEKLALSPNLEAVRQIVSRPENATDCTRDTKAFLELLVHDLPSIPLRSVSERSVSREACLVFWAMVCLGLEWWAERRLRRNGT